jgi:hypothetical protein
VDPKHNQRERNFLEVVAYMRKPLVICFLLVSIVAASSLSEADEGMWLYNAFPKDRLKAKYGFDATQEWLDHIRMSSARFTTGGSGAFVSADGLTLTNHHVAADCIHDLSVNGKDYMENGFYAATPTSELRCPEMAVEQLIGIDNVTSNVNSAVTPGMSSADASQSQRAAMSKIEKECADSSERRCEVVTLFSGAAYHLYRYKRYSDVRLVFAPEYAMAFFGGDPDNYKYPRYDLDVAFLRVYEHDNPARLASYFRWSSGGVKENDLVFVSGSPGATNRWKTVSQLEFLRDTQYPTLIASQSLWIAMLDTFAASSPENARMSQEFVYGAKNGFKAFVGYEAGLRDKNVMETKAAEEARLRAAYRAKNGGDQDPWQKISEAMKVQSEIYVRLIYLERLRGFASQLARYARTLVRSAEEKTKPNGERLREYRDSALPGLEQQLFADTPVYLPLERAVLTESLSQMKVALRGSSFEFVKVLGNKEPEQIAKSLIAGTKLADPAVRKRLYQEGEPAIESSTDPLIVLMRSVDAEARAVRKRFEDEVDSVERSEGSKIARARFSEFGFSEPPDATSTLRLSYGTVKGYIENAKPIPYFTDIRGAFQYAGEHDNKPPYKLPESWIGARNNLAIDTTLDFVSTADVLGGNSGSPVLNRSGEIVGVVFDGNSQALASNFVYSDESARAVSVDGRAIKEALRKIYAATELAGELGQSQSSESRVPKN